MAGATLVGPPEIYILKPNPNPTTTVAETIATAETTTTPAETIATAETTTATITNDGFIDEMVANFNSLATNQQPPMGLTENMSPTFLSTGNPCLDFFFHVVPDTPPETLIQRLQLAWSQNPLTALKLVCNLRGVRGTDYQAITRKYKEKGYGSAVPQIVFWNLRDSRATPVPSTQKGVALVSGFSKNLLTLFLNNEGDISPVEAMEAAIAGPEYQKLVVLD
ncbi:unnamed protein product [Lathyrus oleraceus]|uniref:DUF7788 domain-containing protein n=1 Tax=Pisum sativum TaxID=3888 RepID=A0A9D4YF99_PEA|nr:hypothetical protein KIW84_023857 [Pisum sativum]